MKQWAIALVLVVALYWMGVVAPGSLTAAFPPGVLPASAATSTASSEAETPGAAELGTFPIAHVDTVTLGTISVDGILVCYKDWLGADSAPLVGAGLWAGSDSTTDGELGYFVGHNPGDFNMVMDLGLGDPVTVNDRAGHSRTYSVVDVFTVPDTATYDDISTRISGYGESVVLQTCVGDGESYRIVVAA